MKINWSFIFLPRSIQKMIVQKEKELHRKAYLEKHNETKKNQA